MIRGTAYLCGCLVLSAQLSAQASIASKAASTPELIAALVAMPQQVASEKFDPYVFTRILDQAVESSDLNVGAVAAVLQPMFRSGDREVRRNAVLVCDALSRRVSSAGELAPLLPTLQGLSTDADNGVKRGLVLALGSLKPLPPPSARETLKVLLLKRTEPDRTRIGVSWFIARYASADGPSEDAVVQVLNDDTEPEILRGGIVREIAHAHLSPRLKSAITDLLYAQPGPLRESAVTACAELGSLIDTSAIARLQNIASDIRESASARSAASTAINKLTMRNEIVGR